jgi:hypothetical protein
MKLKDIAILVLVLIVIYIVYTRRSSGGPNPPPPANCDPTPVDAKIACITAKPDFPLAGDMIENGAKKYCCKSS